jgi:hypothetical protein
MIASVSSIQFGAGMTPITVDCLTSQFPIAAIVSRAEKLLESLLSGIPG